MTPGPQRFTMLELIAVMLVLAAIMAAVAPRLAGFFGGQRLDDEARRLWALTRYARSQAITRAVPVRVWLAPGIQQYGLEVVPGFGETMDPRSYTLPDGLQLAQQPPPTTTSAQDTLTLTWWPDGTLSDDSPSALLLRDRRHPDDTWYLAHQPTWPTYVLTREAPP